MEKIVALCVLLAFNVEHLFQDTKLIQPLDDSIIGTLNIDKVSVYEGDIDVFVKKI